MDTVSGSTPLPINTSPTQNPTQLNPSLQPPTPTTNTNTENPSQNPSTPKTIITIILLLLFFPLGIIFMFLWMKWPVWVKAVVTLAALLVGAINIVALYFGITSLMFFGSIPNCMSQCETAIDRNECMIACTNNETLPTTGVITSPTIKPTTTISLEGELNKDLSNLPYNFSYNVVYGENIPPIKIGSNVIGSYVAIQVVGEEKITAENISEIGKQTCSTLERLRREVSQVQVETAVVIDGEEPLTSGIGGTCQEWQDGEVYEALNSTSQPL